MREQPSLNGLDTPVRPTDRLFIGIIPDANTAGRIERCAKGLGAKHALRGLPLGTDRYHITLHHIDDYAGLPPGKVAAAKKAAASIAAAPFEVAFDRAISFSGRPGNRPLVLIGSNGLSALAEFQCVLGQALMKAGLGRSVNRSYAPHMTLLYDRKGVDEQCIETIHWTVNEFVLVHSLLRQTRYEILARWPLRS
jgi:2'-5' RNA ligase